MLFVLFSQIGVPCLADACAQIDLHLHGLQMSAELPLAKLWAVWEGGISIWGELPLEVELKSCVCETVRVYGGVEVVIILFPHTPQSVCSLRTQWFRSHGLTLCVSLTRWGKSLPSPGFRRVAVVPCTVKESRQAGQLQCFQVPPCLSRKPSRAESEIPSLPEAGPTGLFLWTAMWKDQRASPEGAAGL